MILPRSNPPYKATHPTFGHSASSQPPYGATHPHFGHNSKGGLSAGAIASIVIAVLVVVAAIAWVLRVLLLHRSLGLPPPTWRTFIPCLPSKPSASYTPTRPGGILDFLKPSRGGYTGTNERSAHTWAALGDNQAWDSRMDRDDDELEYRGAAPGVKDAVLGVKEAVIGRGREQDLSAGAEMERGRTRNRGAEVYVEYQGPQPQGNPFDNDIRGPQRKKDGFGDIRVQGGRQSMDSERRSVFKEEV